MLRGKIHQVQIKLAEEVFKVKQVESQLQEISVVATEFKEKTQEIAETLQGQLTWLETNIEHPENAPVKSPEKLQIKCDIVNFSSRDAERLIEAVEKTTDKCTKFYKKVLITHNKCQTSSTQKLQYFPAHEEHLKQLKDKLQEVELNI